jgi:cytochrome b
MSNRIKIWDLPTRLFHMALALLVLGAFVTVNMGDEWMQLHGQLGLCTLSLIGFRLIWGIFGGHWSKFKHFPLGLAQIFAYLSKRSPQTSSYAGHNPLGSLSTLLMLAVFLLQALTGLCSDDEVLLSGPLTKYLSSHQIEMATFYHSEIGQPLILLIVSLHVLAVLLYKFLFKQNLITPMITGYKEDIDIAIESQDTKSSRLLGLFIFLLLLSILFYSLPI